MAGACWSVGQLVGWAVGRSVGRAVGRSVGRAVGRWVGRWVGRSVGRGVERSSGRAVERSVGGSVCRSVGRSIGRSVGRSVGAPKRSEKQVGGSNAGQHLRGKYDTCTGGASTQRWQDPIQTTFGNYFPALTLDPVRENNFPNKNNNTALA